MLRNVMLATPTRTVRALGTPAVVGAVALALVAMVSLACQSPTDPDETVDYDDVVDVSALPDPISADPSSDGRTYRVPRNNLPDEILPFDWHAVFSVTISFNQNALDDDVDVDFPVRLTATTLTVKQAVGGVITPPTGSDTEHYDFAPISASGNTFGAVSSPLNMSLEIWYDLPSLRKEAVVTVTFTFQDNDGATFQKAQEIRINP